MALTWLYKPTATFNIQFSNLKGVSCMHQPNMLVGCTLILTLYYVTTIFTALFSYDQLVSSRSKIMKQLTINKIYGWIQIILTEDYIIYCVQYSIIFSMLSHDHILISDLVISHCFMHSLSGIILPYLAMLFMPNKFTMSCVNIQIKNNYCNSLMLAKP